MTVHPKDCVEHQLVRNSTGGQNCFWCGLSDLEIATGIRQISQVGSMTNSISQASLNSTRQTSVDSPNPKSMGRSQIHGISSNASGVINTGITKRRGGTLDEFM